MGERLAALLNGAGLSSLARSRGRGSVMVLNYHHAERRSLARHLDFLSSKYAVCDLADLLAGRWPSGPGVAITFDDGYRDNYTDAFPELKQRRLPATIFLVSTYVGTEKRFPWDQRSTVMDWEQVKEMSEAGVAFGSHTRTHPILSSLDTDAARAELEGSRRELEERLGKPVPLLAYPRGQPGDIGPEAVILARKAGYQAALSTVSGRFRPADNPFMIPRVSVNAEESDAVLALKASGAWSWLARFR